MCFSFLLYSDIWDICPVTPMILWDVYYVLHLLFDCHYCTSICNNVLHLLFDCNYCTSIINIYYIHSLGSLHRTVWPHLHSRHNPPTSFNTTLTVTQHFMLALPDIASSRKWLFVFILLGRMFPGMKPYVHICDVSVQKWLLSFPISPTLQQISWTPLW